MDRGRPGRRVPIALVQGGLLGSLALLWEWAVRGRPSWAFLVGSPQGIWREFMAGVTAGGLPGHVAVTLGEAVAGFVAGTICGTAFGLGLWFSPAAYRLARPYVIALGALPVFALGPVLIFWFGTGMLSKVALAFLATFSVAVSQSYTGAQEADSRLIAVIEAFGGNRRHTFKLVVLPTALVWVLAGVRLNIAMALLGAFIGEFISSRRGLGHYIILAEGLYNVNQVWVGIGCIIFLAVGLHAGTGPIEAWAKRWK